MKALLWTEQRVRLLANSAQDEVRFPPVELELAPGDISFHHTNCIHRTGEPSSHAPSPPKHTHTHTHAHSHFLTWISKDETLLLRK